MGARPPITGISGRDPGMHCSAKEGSRLVARLIFLTGTLFQLSIASTVVLLSVTVCSWCFQYTHTTRRKGKKGPGALAGKMLCPYGAERNVQNYDPKKITEDDLVDSGDSDAE